VHAKIGFLDDDVRPNEVNQLSCAHDLARPVDQSNQNVESAAADGDRCAILDEQSLYDDQAEGAKRYCSAGR
jgi:hypothetical protein